MPKASAWQAQNTKRKTHKGKNQFDFNCAWLSGINFLRKYVKAIILIFISLLPRQKKNSNNNLCVSTTWVYNIRASLGGVRAATDDACSRERNSLRSTLILPLFLFFFVLKSDDPLRPNFIWLRNSMSESCLCFSEPRNRLRFAAEFFIAPRSHRSLF